MKKRPTTLVGVLGLPDSGKTACLVSAYLLLARGSFDGYSYIDSETLMAFEQISRGSRQWAKGAEPTQYTTHTEMADDRTAGFLHLRIRREEDGCPFDILLPDLPGEWSRQLIDDNDTERFDFLRSASVIWITVDGRAFAESGPRNYAIYRTEILLERLAPILPTPRPRVYLVPSWRDLGEFPQDAFEAIRAEAQKYDIDIGLLPIASFSKTAMQPGTGVAELIDTALRHDQSPPAFWPEPIDQAPRTLIRFRSAA